MAVSDVVTFIIAGILALLAMLMVAIGALHVWLRTTVGKFNSNETMEGKTVLITGGNSGLGLETVRDLAKRGARIIMASRKLEVASRVRDSVVRDSGNQEIYIKKLDLSSQQSIREFAADILATETKIDVLIHNSGCASTSVKKKSVDGIEMTMATNHYGPFLLTHLLIDLLRRSAPARIVIISSAYYKIARVDLNNLNPLDTFPFYLYYVTKTANIMFGMELAKRLSGTGITVNCVNPGMCNTAIFKKVPFPFNLFVRHSFKNSKEGAQTMIMCAVDQSLDGVSGKYFSDCRETALWSFAKDESNNAKFWKESLRIANVTSADPKI